MTTTLTAKTPVGTFTRATKTAYTHVVVWNSPRAASVAKTQTRGSGVYGRWIKDGGYGVTWHGSLAAAQKAASAGYLWDKPGAWPKLGNGATLIGVFAVETV